MPTDLPPTHGPGERRWTLRGGAFVSHRTDEEGEGHWDGERRTYIKEGPDLETGEQVEVMPVPPGEIVVGQREQHLERIVDGLRQEIEEARACLDRKPMLDGQGVRLNRIDTEGAKRKLDDVLIHLRQALALSDGDRQGARGCTCGADAKSEGEWLEPQSPDPACPIHGEPRA